MTLHPQKVTSSPDPEGFFSTNEEHLSPYTEHYSDALVLIDATGKVLFASPATHYMLGYSPEELIGREIFAVIHDDDLPETRRLLQDVAAGTISSFVLHSHYLHKNGSVVVVDNSVSLASNGVGDMCYFFAISRETGEERQAQIERARLVAIVDSSDDAIISKTLEGIITSWNHAAGQMFGYTAEEAIGKPITTIIPPHLHQEEANIIRRLRQGNRIDHFETVRLHKDGTLVDVSLSISPVRDDRGQVVGAAKIARNITERKELERRKDDFISMASHELKTPVTALKGFVQMLLRRARQRNEDEFLRFLTRMDVQLNKLTRLISELLDITRMQTGQLVYQEESFDLGALVQEIVENVQETMQTHRLVLEQQERVQVTGDKDRIGQVLMNFLTNAIKYSPRATTVAVRVVTDTEKKRAVVSVQDFGLGIAEAHQQKIFERFYRVNDSTGQTYPGLGIGLYICQEIIKRHGGQITVKSEKGKGSTFSFTLPL